MAKHILIMT